MPAPQGVVLRTVPGYINEDIVREVPRMVREYGSQAHALAQTLKGATAIDTARNIYRAVRKRVGYQLEPESAQRVASPARTWADRKADCKSMAVLTAALLDGLKIPYVIRFVRIPTEKRKAKYGHVYVVAWPDTHRIAIDTTLPYVDVHPAGIEYLDISSAQHAAERAGCACMGNQRMGVIDPVTMTVVSVAAKVAPLVVGAIKNIFGGSSASGSTFYHTLGNQLANYVNLQGLADGRDTWERSQRSQYNTYMQQVMGVLATATPAQKLAIEDWVMRGTNPSMITVPIDMRNRLGMAPLYLSAYRQVVAENAALDRIMTGQVPDLTYVSMSFRDRLKKYIIDLAASGNKEAADIARQAYDYGAAQASVFHTGVAAQPGLTNSAAPASTQAQQQAPAVVPPSYGLMQAQQQGAQAQQKTPWLWYGIGAGVLVAAGTGIIIYNRKKKKK